MTSIASPMSGFIRAPSIRGQQTGYTVVRQQALAPSGKEGEAVQDSPRSDTRIRADTELLLAKNRLVIAKMFTFCDASTTQALCLHVDSVYGAALAMPQIARSTGWPGALNILAIRCYFFLALTILLQWFLVHSLVKEEFVMDKFAGQMYLCNFGARKDGCPDADGCLGPGGTRITPPRLYGYTQWYLQNFVKKSLLSLFPDKEDDINERVDPGEYGVESMQVRFVCTFIFVLTGMHDFYEVAHMLRLLYNVPSQGLEELSWINCDGDKTVFKVAGMPPLWKIVSIFGVAFPKFTIWLFTMRSGIMFLMDTAGIDDTIVNTTALGFILQLDELIFDVLTTENTQRIMDGVQGYAPVPKLVVEEDDEHLVERSGANRWTFAHAFPRRFVFCIFFWIALVADYYWRACARSEDGTLVSVPMYLPKSTDVSFVSALMPFLSPVEADDKPYWTMPKDRSI
eukprot:gnl/TRDRNA2_/TRDRNA2_176349_c12_seq2.p1 gnl/TRDRNA2_/TRDRNA2_176349_c12~~gnl/TRDRNA2_/TRDRNA2_176349_c12_seq2.p1  ORF type:complete len:456 (-),score=64.09 gnl/TRDRNA2_/TRDRNA2_176349_c12_seq2:84-1451(-)